MKGQSTQPVPHLLGVVLLLLVLVPSAVDAQTAASSFDELQTALKTGETVSVTDDSGHRTKGKVADLSASSLALFVGRKDQSQVFTVDRIAKIVRHDSLDNGIFIGLAAGAGLGWGWLRAVCGPPGFDDECVANAWPITFSIGVGIGVAAGAIADAAIKRTVYLARTPPTSRTVAVSPILSKRRTGVSVSMQF